MTKTPPRIPKAGALLKQHFFAGLLVIVPLAVIAWILIWALRSIWQIHHILPEALKPEHIAPNAVLGTLLNLAFTVAATLILALGVSVLGWASKQFLGRKALEVLSGLIQHIPVIRSIYSALDQLLRTMTAGGGKQFNRVVYVEYPRKGVWALAFVTGAAQKRGPAGPHWLNIYVPTTPNPTSGFHLIVPESEVQESGMKVEEAFRTILSLGIAQTEERSGAHGG